MELKATLRVIVAISPQNLLRLLSSVYMFPELVYNANAGMQNAGTGWRAEHKLSQTCPTSLLCSADITKERDSMQEETLPSGTVLHGRYRIERVLGSGGFGHVYLAVDLVTSQQYAIKEYLVTGSSGQEQLKHEATVLSQLHHPNLPAFQDAFIERGRYYVVINYIEGSDLTDLIRIARQRNEVVPIARITDWLRAICDAVMFLHSQLPPVIHRDIKPDNIRIMPDGTAVLVDLGNAKSSADGARTLFFIRHQGTPGYAPPEQYPGGSGTDSRSDVYALGGTLYFALTTHEPPSVSVRNESMQKGRPDLPSLQEILANNPPEESPEANAARQFRLGVTKPSKPAPRHSRHVAQLGTLQLNLLNQINNIIQKAMAMRPKDRYQTVADFASDLKKIIAALPALPPPPRPIDPHSTQPDLPMLYEALQAAKENKTANTADSSSTSSIEPSAPATQPAGGDTCPRCNAPLASSASYCPQCGTSLNNPSKNNTSYAQIRKDISAEETMLVRPQAQAQQVIAGQRPKATPVAKPPATTSSSSTVPETPVPPISSRVKSTPGPIPRAGSTATQVSPVTSSAQQSATQSQVQVPPEDLDHTPSSFLGAFQPGMKWLISALAVLIVLLVILMLFVFSLMHH
jgi:serine/threonine protein kinase